VTAPIRKSPLLGIQQAAYTRLNTDPALAGKIFDEVPEGTPHPYVVIGDAVESMGGSHSEYGSDVMVDFHVWSAYRGFLEGVDLGAKIVELLDHQPLDVEGHRVIVVRHAQTMPLRDPDPRIRHVSVRFRVITEQEM